MSPLPHTTCWQGSPPILPAPPRGALTRVLTPAAAMPDRAPARPRLRPYVPPSAPPARAGSGAHQALPRCPPRPDPPRFDACQAFFARRRLGQTRVLRVSCLAVERGSASGELSCLAGRRRPPARSNEGFRRRRLLPSGGAQKAERKALAVVGAVSLPIERGSPRQAGSGARGFGGQ